MHPHERLCAVLVAFDRFVGHGRALESGLIFVKLQFAAMLMTLPRKDLTIAALVESGLPSSVLAAPFIFAASLSLTGLILNRRGLDRSRHFRIMGASIGMMIWIYILVENMLIGLFGSGINPWCTMGIISSVWIIRRGTQGVPSPGSLAAR